MRFYFYISPTPPPPDRHHSNYVNSKICVTNRLNFPNLFFNKIFSKRASQPRLQKKKKFGEFFSSEKRNLIFTLFLQRAVLELTVDENVSLWYESFQHFKSHLRNWYCYKNLFWSHFGTHLWRWLQKKSIHTSISLLSFLKRPPRKRKQRKTSWTDHRDLRQLDSEVE